uniref:Uncharacterized protein n=1 Tax=Junco hyemalis TaxID=40217 RepID=A0A8C5JUI2_JUNHY
MAAGPGGPTMWFGGSVPAAIAAAKERSSVFVVFVAGEDEQSTEMAARWEDEKVTEAASDGFVAIKIDTKRFEPILILSLIQSFIDDDEKFFWLSYLKPNC